MLITTTGIVIRERTFGEADKFIDILTPEYGVMELFVRNVKKISSTNLSGTQMLAYSKFSVNKRKDRYTLISSEPISIFYNIRLDIEKLALAMYFSDVIKYVVTSEQSAQDIMRLFLNTLHYLSSGQRPEQLLKSIFELRIVSELGMMPAILACSKCLTYSTYEMYFLLGGGNLLCEDCYNLYANDKSEAETDFIIKINQTLLHTIRYITLSEFEKLWNFKLSGDSTKKLNYVTENYLIKQLDREFKTLEFYKIMNKTNTNGE